MPQTVQVLAEPNQTYFNNVSELKQLKKINKKRHNNTSFTKLFSVFVCKEPIFYSVATIITNVGTEGIF